jgi:transketolase
MTTKRTIEELKRNALEARRTLITIACTNNATHIGSSLSHIDITTALYGSILNLSPETVADPLRDRFFLSKGHAALGYYIVLSQYGFIPRAELQTYSRDDTRLAGHPVYRSAPGIEATSGSLGHSLPMALGLSLAGQRDGLASKYVVLLSDGECDEGSNWEAIISAGHLKLDNLTVVVDYNKVQSFGMMKDVLNLEPFADKWRACNWAVREVDGHDMDALVSTLGELPFEKGKPSVLLAHTVKGKGVPYMENTVEWHYLNVKPEMLEETLAQVY